jgi:hypothetical protein
MISLGIEARNVEKLIAHHDARIRFRERFSKAGIGFNVRRQQPIVAINYQNVFDFSGRGCRRAKRRKTHEQACENHLPHEYGSQSRERQVAVRRAQEDSPHEMNPSASIHRGDRKILS